MAHLSGFASLNADWLAPHDTINAVVKSADGSHGVFELSVAAPTQSRASASNGNGIIVTGTNGYITVDQATARDPVTGTEQPVFRVVIRSVSRDADGKQVGPEREEVIDEPMRGVELQLASFFAAALEGKGNNDGNGLGSPRGALCDVAFIEAALNSHGELVDLEKLVTPA